MAMRVIGKIGGTILIAAIMVAGCGDEHDDHDHSDKEEHSCAHFESGPNTTVMAISDPTEMAPESFAEHTRIDVVVPDGTDVAIVQWTPEEAGEFKFWLSQDVTFSLMQDGNALTAEATGGAAMGCEMLAVASRTYDVEAATYTIQMGPGLTAGSTIQFVAEHAGEHEHEGE